MSQALWDVMGLSRGAGREGHAKQSTQHQQGHRGESGGFVEDMGGRPPGEVSRCVLERNGIQLVCALGAESESMDSGTHCGLCPCTGHILSGLTLFT